MLQLLLLFAFDADFGIYFVYVCCSLYSYIFVFFFFFSSRRRHTRLVSDWSSDVCSSDLAPNPGALESQAIAGPNRIRLAGRDEVHRVALRTERPQRLPHQQPADVVG